MRYVGTLILVLLLGGCFGPAKFDATNQETIRASAIKVKESLSSDQQAEFDDALKYFFIGGEDGFRAMMATAFAGKSKDMDVEAFAQANIQAIHGLTGEQILAKYHEVKEKQKLVDEERKRVQSLKQEADKLLSDLQFEAALERYKTLSEIPSGLQSSEEGIAKTQQAMMAFQEKMVYLDKIEITEFVAKRIDTYSSKGVPAVRISLKNKGDRTLNEVKVMVYFQNSDGNTIFEEDYFPVNVNSYSSGNKPLKPGYVQEMESGKYYTLDSALSEWAEGKATAKVTDLKFAN